LYCKNFRTLFVTTFLKGKSKCNLGICKGFFIGFYWQVVIVNQNKAISKVSFRTATINYNLKDIFCLTYNWIY